MVKSSSFMNRSLETCREYHSSAHFALHILSDYCECSLLCLRQIQYPIIANTFPITGFQNSIIKLSIVGLTFTSQNMTFSFMPIHASHNTYVFIWIRESESFAVLAFESKLLTENCWFPLAFCLGISFLSTYF